MEFDFTRLSAEDRYKLLVSFVVPRPIALVGTVGRDGVSNAAPISFFNVFAQTPPLLILGIQGKADGSLKDTTRNILDTGEFVVNMVDQSIAEPMIVCSVDFPPEVDETAMAGLHLIPSRAVKPGRIAEAPAAFECRLERTIDYPNRCLVFGEVVHMHVGDDFIDAETLHVRAPRYCPIARLHADFYISSGNQYEIPKMTYEDWQANVKGSMNGNPKEQAFLAVTTSTD